MEILKTDINDVLIIKPKLFEDSRGYFYESFNKDIFQKETGIKTEFVQDNQSKSVFGVLRGLHFQTPPYAQSKLVRVIKGSVLDVAVDIRAGSPTFGKYVSIELNEDNHLQLFIPRGFAHGFVVLSDIAIFQYKCDNFYSPYNEGSIIWNDIDLNIDWQIPTNKIILSEKDKKNDTFKNCSNIFNYNQKLYY